MLMFSIPIQHSFIHPDQPNKDPQESWSSDRATHPICSLPWVIFKVLEYAPRLIDPPTPPTLRHMEHTHNFMHASAATEA